MATQISSLKVVDESPGPSTSHLSLPEKKTEATRSKFLSSLGRPTLRGVRKCAKCGTFTGTRGIRCKNKTCDQVFKTVERKRPEGPEAVKIITGVALLSN